MLLDQYLENITNMFDLQDKVIVITGAKGLLGQSFVQALEQNNATVVEADVQVTEESDTAFALDITSEASIESTIAKIVAQHGKIDGWVNNAYPRTKDWGNKFEHIEAESWRQNIDMHLNGYFLCCQKVLEQMKKQGFGSLVNISSIYGLLGPDFSVYANSEMTMPAAYAAIKGGLNTLTRYLASYYGAQSIRVNSISPGGIFNNQPEPFVKAYESKVPLKRMGTPQDIAPSVVFLMSNEASYITGHNLLIDGGWSII